MDKNYCILLSKEFIEPWLEVLIQLWVSVLTEMGVKCWKRVFFSHRTKSFSTLSSLYRWSLSHKRYLEVRARVLLCVTVGQGGSYQVNKKQVKTILCHSIPSTWVLTVEKNSVDNNDANNVFLFFFTTGDCISKTGAPRTFQQGLFKKEKLHYLNVSKLRTFAVYDFFDCTFECLRNSLCLSINVAVLRGADGKLWCELLSSDKYKDASQYSGNKSSHHFSVGCARIHFLF